MKDSTIRDVPQLEVSGRGHIKCLHPEVTGCWEVLQTFSGQTGCGYCTSTMWTIGFARGLQGNVAFCDIIWVCECRPTSRWEHSCRSQVLLLQAASPSVSVTWLAAVKKLMPLKTQNVGCSLTRCLHGFCFVYKSNKRRETWKGGEQEGKWVDRTRRRRRHSWAALSKGGTGGTGGTGGSAGRGCSGCRAGSLKFRSAKYADIHWKCAVK